MRPLRSTLDPAFRLADGLLIRTPGLSCVSTSIRAVLRKSVDYLPEETAAEP